MDEEGRMTEEQKLTFQNLSAVISLIGPIASAMILWAIKSVSKNLFDAIVEVKLLRQIVTDLKSEIADLPKMRVDINEAHTRIKFLQLNNSKQKGKQ